MSENKLICALDFDGVIVEHSFPEMGELLPFVTQGMHALHEKFHIIIWTCRDGNFLVEAAQLLKKERLPFDRLNENIVPYFTRKVYADLYIDDRNLGGFPGWPGIMRWLDNNFEHWRAEHKGGFSGI